MQDVCKLYCNILLVKGFVNKFDGTKIDIYFLKFPSPLTGEGQGEDGVYVTIYDVTFILKYRLPE